ncbi:MAG: AAA family ATPase, partial [Rhodothermales bacterium]|nr:AAA family ATPase [Rhodothermales bacterium]
MRDELSITRLEIDRMYGRRLDLSIDDLEAGINILYGPNGSGKTTLARGLESVLWPSTAASDGRIVEVSMTIGGVPWSASLERGRTIWRREGREAGPPPLPSEDQRDRYQLLLPELIAADDENFARLVLREMVGGVDVQSAADMLDFRLPSPRSGFATQAAADRVSEVADLISRRRALKTDMDRLGRLESELDEAVRASRRIAYLKDLLAALGARDVRIRAERILESFPSHLADMQGDEMDRLESLRESRTEGREQLKKARADIEENEAALAASLLDGPIPADSLGELDERVRNIERAESDIRAAEKALRAAGKEEEEAWTTLGIGVDRDHAGRLDVPGFEAVSGFVRKKRDVQARADARRKLIEMIGEPPSDEETDRLKDAARLLVRWLQDASGASRVRRYLLLAAGLLHILTGVVLGVLVTTWGLVLVLPGAGAAWLAWQLPQASGSSDASVHRRSFEQTGLERPASWTPEEVFRSLDDLQRRISESRWSDILREERRRAHTDDEPAETESELQAAREELLRQTGLDAGLSDEGLTYIIGRIRDWQQASAGVAGAREALKNAEEHVVQAINDFHETSAQFGDRQSTDPPADAAEASAAVRRLRGADSEYRQAASRLDAAHKDAGRVSGELEKLDEHIASLFKQAGLEGQDDAALAELCRRKSEFDEARSALSEAVGAEKTRLESVRDHDLFDESDLERSTSEVELDIESLSEHAARVDTLREEIRSIRQDVSRAESSRELEIARSAMEDALSVLDGERIGHVRSMVGAKLAEFVSEQTYEQQLPAVFKRARKIFGRVTSGRYELRFRDSSFTAYDTVVAREHELGELSTGTRVQLLLSVRIAFIEEQEGGVRLPIVLDETLANSDDARAEAIVRTVLRICQTGRQVFYLTARDDEVAQWVSVADRLDDVPTRIVALSGSRPPTPRRSKTAEQTNGSVPAFTREIPRPEDRTHAEYGNHLGVEPWNPYAPIGALHLWYIVEDVDILYR